MLYNIAAMEKNNDENVIKKLTMSFIQCYNEKIYDVLVSWVLTASQGYFEEKLGVSYLYKNKANFLRNENGQDFRI